MYNFLPNLNPFYNTKKVKIFRHFYCIDVKINFYFNNKEYYETYNICW